MLALSKYVAKGFTLCPKDHLNMRLNIRLNTMAWLWSKGLLAAITLFQRKITPVFLVISLGALLAGCAGAPKNPAQADTCQSGLTKAYHALDLAKSKGFYGTVDYTKAASLLTAAKVQQEFGKYPNCINKVTRAMYYIGESQKN